MENHSSAAVFDGDQVTDVDLEELKSMTQFQALALDGCANVTDDVLSDLKKLSPKLEIQGRRLRAVRSQANGRGSIPWVEVELQQSCFIHPAAALLASKPRDV